MYKRRKGWWEEYGVYIRKSPTRDVWFVGFGGMSQRAGGPVWEYDSFDAARDDVEEFINAYWEHIEPDIVDAAVDGGLQGRRQPF